MARQNQTPYTIPTYGHPALGFKDGAAKPYRYVVDNFLGVGQDSFTEPPAQEPQSASQLSNFLVSETGVLLPRWGTSSYASLGTTLANPAHIWDYQTATGSITQNSVTTTGFKAILAQSSAHLIGITDTSTPTVFSTDPFTPTADNYMVVSRDYAYFNVDLKKLIVNSINLDSTTYSVTATNWGISPPPPGAIPSITVNSANVTTITNRPSILLNGWGANGHVGDYEGGVNQGHSNPLALDPGTTNGYSNAGNAIDGSADSAATAIYDNTHQYAGVVYTFNGVGGSTVSGTYLRILSEVPTGGGGRKRDAGMWYSLDGGTTWTKIYQATVRPKQTDSVSIPAAQTINNIQVLAFMDSHDDMAHSVYDIRLEQPSVGGGPQGGSVNLYTGRVYYTCFMNSVTGHISDLSDPTQITSVGTVLNGNVVLSNLPVSGDSQVDTLVILATADGGDATTLYLVAQVSNGTTTYTDVTAETDLLTAQVYLSTDSTTGDEFGVSGNQRPPGGSKYCVKHKGRIYLSSGRFVYFSKAIDEMTTSTGFVAGKYEESFPGDYFFDISEGPESITGFMPYGDLYIATEKTVRRLSGDGPTNFAEPEIVFSGVGVASQETWQPLFLEGAPIGTAWLTPDLRVIFSDFNTFKDIGTPVQDVLNTINVSALSACRASYLSLGAYAFYVLMLPINGASTPNITLVYNLRTQRWATWDFSAAFNPLAYLYHVQPSGFSVNLILTGTTIYKLDTAAPQDAWTYGGGGTGFPCTFATAWLDLDDPSYFKLLNEFELVGDSQGGNRFNLTVYGSNGGQDFWNPHVILNAQNLTSSPPIFKDTNQILKAYLASSACKYRWYKFIITATPTYNSTAIISIQHTSGVGVSPATVVIQGTNLGNPTFAGVVGTRLEVFGTTNYNSNNYVVTQVNSSSSLTAQVSDQAIVNLGTPIEVTGTVITAPPNLHIREYALHVVPYTRF